MIQLESVFLLKTTSISIVYGEGDEMSSV